MRQGRAIAVGESRSRSRVLTLLLGGGALVAVWWFLMTGTAHAAESPLDGPVTALQEKTKPVEKAKERVRTQVVDRALVKVEKTVQKAADTTTPVVDAVVSKTAQTVGKTVGKTEQAIGQTKQAAKATTSLIKPSQVAGDRVAKRHRTAVAELRASSGIDAMAAIADDGATPVPDAAAHTPSGSPALDHHQAPKPTPTDTDGSGSGTGGVAALPQSDLLLLPAPTGTPVDSGHLRPVELAYPPGCSPD